MGPWRAESPHFWPGEWRYFLRNTQKLTAIPPALAQESAIEYAFGIANRAQLSPDELELQERREMFIQDQRGALEKAAMEGQARGEAKVRQEAEALARQKTLDAAKNLKALGLGDEQIARALGLSLAEVAQLQQ